MTTDIRARFEQDTADHEMTVLRDDGLYRHLAFRRMVWRPPLAEPQPTSFYWFDLITVPGALIFQGDGESYTFRRVEDMFKFFRGPVGRINETYWSEKLTSGCREAVMRYDRDMFEACVRQDIADRDDLPGLAAAVQEEILDNDAIDLDHEESALAAVRDFAFYLNEADRFDHRKRPDFEFYDTWEWGVRDYHWWFRWALHAIVWGIGQYDAHHCRPVVVAPVLTEPARPAAEGAPSPEPTPSTTRTASRVVTLQTAGERL